MKWHQIITVSLITIEQRHPIPSEKERGLGGGGWGEMNKCIYSCWSSFYVSVDTMYLHRFLMPYKYMLYMYIVGENVPGFTNGILCGSISGLPTLPIPRSLSIFE